METLTATDVTLVILVCALLMITLVVVGMVHQIIKDSQIQRRNKMMNEQKIPTVADQLNKLPIRYATLAVANTAPDLLICPARSVAMALTCAFTWEGTEEGIAFWQAVTDWADSHLDENVQNSGHKLPEIPTGGQA